MTADVGPVDRWRRLRGLLVLSVGGVVFALVVLWVAQAIAALAITRFLAGEGDVLWLLAGAVAGCLTATLVIYLPLRMIGWGTSYWAPSCGWTVGTMLVWGLGAALGFLTWWAYLLFWFGFGILGTLLFNPGPSRGQYATGRKIARPRGSYRPQPATLVPSSGAQSRVLSPDVVPKPEAPRSPFGRIPRSSVDLIQGQVGIVRDLVYWQIPYFEPQAVREVTLKAILQRTLQDWWKNGNTSGLIPEDVADLRSFIALAKSLPMEGLGTQEGQAVYRAALEALLEDWLQNWNAGDRSGPPDRN